MLRPTGWLLAVSGAALGLAAAIACQPAPAATPAATARAATTAAGAATATAAAPTAVPKVEQLAEALTISTTNISPSWDPLWPLSSSGMQAQRLVGEALVILDDGGTVRPALATAWSQPNPTTTRFVLRPNVKFHNGEALTAQVIADNVQRMLTAPDPQQLSTRQSRFQGINGARVVDPMTAEVTTAAPDPLVLQKLANLFIVAPAQVNVPIIQDIPIGTGAYKGTQYVQNQRFVVERNADYWGDKGFLQRASLVLVPDQATAVAGVRAGDLDIAYDIPPDLGEQLKAVGFNQLIRNLADVNTIDLNPAFELFRDKRVRQALNLAVNKQELAQAVFLNTGKLTQGQFAYEGLAPFNPNLRAYPFDVARARALLAEAGFPAGARATAGGSSASNTVLQAVQAYFRTVGLDFSISIYPLARFGSLQNNIEPGKDPIWSTRVNFFNVVDAGQALENYHSGAASKRYNNPEYDAVILAARTELDATRRATLLRQAAQIMFDDPPNIIIQQHGYLYGHSPKVTEFKPLYDTSYNLATIKKLR